MVREEYDYREGAKINLWRGHPIVLCKLVKVTSALVVEETIPLFVFSSKHRLWERRIRWAEASKKKKNRTKKQGLGKVTQRNNLKIGDEDLTNEMDGLGPVLGSCD